MNAEEIKDNDNSQIINLEEQNVNINRGYNSLFEDSNLRTNLINVKKI